jgi:hypothetical protein
VDAAVAGGGVDGVGRRRTRTSLTSTAAAVAAVAACVWRHQRQRGGARACRQRHRSSDAPIDTTARPWRGAVVAADVRRACCSALPCACRARSQQRCNASARTTVTTAAVHTRKGVRLHVAWSTNACCVLHTRTHDDGYGCGTSPPVVRGCVGGSVVGVRRRRRFTQILSGVDGLYTFLPSLCNQSVRVIRILVNSHVDLCLLSSTRVPKL